MRPVSVCIALLAAIVIGGGPPQKPVEAKSGEAPVEVYADADAYKVYAAALAIDSWYWEGSNEILIVREIPPREWAPAGAEQILQGRTASVPEMEQILQSFREANKEPRLLNSEVDLHRAHRLVRSTDVEAALAKGAEGKNSDSWQGFRAEFPNTAGYVRLSAVGFNATKTMALVYVEHHCGTGCGAANYYILQKLGDVWVKYFPPNFENEKNKS
ncbi:MAG TPA: hypothetical protein VMJ35_04290 [Dongiaceae bacterium]|nr:hypothetical protein [Dongiaceae bacterium]